MSTHDADDFTSWAASAPPPSPRNRGGVVGELLPHADGIMTLWAKGYRAPQIAIALAERTGITATPAAIVRAVAVIVRERSTPARKLRKARKPSSKSRSTLKSAANAAAVVDHTAASSATDGGKNAEVNDQPVGPTRRDLHDL